MPDPIDLAIANLTRSGEPLTTANLDRELNEACPYTGEPRVDVAAEMVKRKWRLVGGAWERVEVEVKEKLLF